MEWLSTGLLAHVELELRLSGVVSKRGSEPVKVGEAGDGSGAGGESEHAGGGIE